MSRDRVTDEASVLPAAEMAGHSHPLPRLARWALTLHGLFIAVLFGLVLYLIAHLDASVTEELDRRTASRDAQQAELARQIDEQNARTLSAVCRVLPDLPQTPNVLSLGRQLGCP